jgi:hypothetical protein
LVESVVVRGEQEASRGVKRGRHTLRGAALSTSEQNRSEKLIHRRGNSAAFDEEARQAVCLLVVRKEREVRCAWPSNGRKYCKLRTKNERLGLGLLACGLCTLASTRVLQQDAGQAVGDADDKSRPNHARRPQKTGLSSAEEIGRKSYASSIIWSKSLA